MSRILQNMLFCTLTILLNAGISRAGDVYQAAGKSPAAVDSQTGRAVGSREMAPDELRKLIVQEAKTIVIDVRDEAEFQKETVKGAVNIPLADLKGRLKDIPKDTTLVFT